MRIGEAVGLLASLAGLGTAAIRLLLWALKGKREQRR
jgi:hypothetical protein